MLLREQAIERGKRMILDYIYSPKDLKNFTQKELEHLAKEMREIIIKKAKLWYSRWMIW